jgi:CHAT domain-containing protein
VELATDGRTSQNTLLTVGDLLATRFGNSRPDLVVPAACESGLVDVSRDDELLGLPTALIVAGARGVVSALWPVREDATVFLIAKFSEFVYKAEQRGCRFRCIVDSHSDASRTAFR